LPGNNHAGEERRCERDACAIFLPHASGSRDFFPGNNAGTKKPLKTLGLFAVAPPMLDAI
jgi:hypothetical protein